MRSTCNFGDTLIRIAKDINFGCFDVQPQVISGHNIAQEKIIRLLGRIIIPSLFVGWNALTGKHQHEQ